jgi:hypothetical protein
MKYNANLIYSLKLTPSKNYAIALSAVPGDIIFIKYSRDKRGRFI